MTPDKIDKNVSQLLKKLKASHEPIYLNVEPEFGAALKDYFPVVQKKVLTEGGKMILGWQIWQSSYLVEAEFHAVWEDKYEQLHDITPKGNNVEKILFVEDDKLIYEEKLVGNIRFNITNNVMVDDLIDVCKAIVRFDNKGERALLYDLSAHLDQKELEHRKYLILLKSAMVKILNNNGNKNTFCVCQSGIKFKDYHGKNLKARIARDI